MGSCLSLSKDPSLFPPSLTLRIIKLSTCTNSPRGLFDYGVDTGLPSEVRVSDECQIVRRGTHIETPRLHTSSSAAIEKLVNVEIHSKHYWLSSPFRGLASSRDSCVWVLANNWEERGKELSEGDVIRLGMCSFAVKKLVCGKKSEEEKCLIAAVEEFSDAEVKCRICLRSENTEEEQIVCSPCKCLGSVRYVHLNCLRRWLKNQLIERENEYFHSYSWQELNCDICHAPYPSTLHSHHRHNSMPCRKRSSDLRYANARKRLHDIGNSERVEWPRLSEHIHCTAGQEERSKNSNRESERRDRDVTMRSN
eukprot:TRINITY_DN7168_c0_g1_i11.p1 TRINITY_DN7168_c0_g1~~TRINITY_DN7168_c0_g1_i11.p1  ORF type:complete len:309 (-),score=21.17 TRINITY_DN7168_c0_g1_i11:370-1296(-)